MRCSHANVHVQGSCYLYLRYIRSGLIGHSWAMLFASAGYTVSIFDADSSRIGAALANIKEKLTHLERSGSVRGKLTVGQQLALINGETTLKNTVKDAFYVQECVPEEVDAKCRVLAEVDLVLGDDAILASSTSAILPSVLSKDLKHKDHFIVAHPYNPPYFVPAVELVPAAWTKPEVVARTSSLMRDIGQTPITCKKEVNGFALGRLQYAVINECWRLVRDGYLSVEDADAVVTEGLGRRYAFLGPLETAHLNAEGMRNYWERYGETVIACAQDLGPPPQLEGNAADDIDRQLRQMVPLEKLEARRKWRDSALADLAKIRATLDNPGSLH